MTILQELDDELKAYPETNVQLEIVEVDFSSGDALNKSETAFFRVRVTNIGLVNMTNVSLRITGLNGATVANNGAAAPFVSEFVTQEIATIPADGGSELTIGSKLKFKAPNKAQASQNLVTATLEDWTGI